MFPGNCFLLFFPGLNRRSALGPICRFIVSVKHVVLNLNPTGIKIMRSPFEQAVGDAPKRAYHSSVLFQRELLVFGGIFPNPGPQPDVCSNELYIFNAGNFELQ